MTTKSSRGIRNHNPGNIEINSNNDWLGQVYPSSDTRFVTFESPIYGIRAISRTLITYFDKYKLDTIEKIVSRWAPPTNNDGAIENDTESYIQSVQKRSNMPRNAPLDLFDYETNYAIVEAIIYHENGKQPYSKNQINRALSLAGLEVPNTTLILRETKKQQLNNNIDKITIGGLGVGFVVEILNTIDLVASKIASIGIPLIILAIILLVLYRYQSDIKEFFKSKI